MAGHAQPYCETEQTPANRRLAMVVGYLSLSAFFGITAYLGYDSWRKDQRQNAELAAASELQIAENGIRDTLSLGHAVISADGEIVEWNAALRKWTRWEDAIGKPLVAIVPESMRQAHLFAFNKAIERVEKGEKPRTVIVECALPRIDDPTKVTHVTIVPTVIKPTLEGVRPYVVAYVFKTSQLLNINVSDRPTVNLSATN